MKKRAAALLLFLCLLCALCPPAMAAEDGIRIAVIDTGISTTAVDPARIAPGNNYIRPQDGTEDKLGHGTAVWAAKKPALPASAPQRALSRWYITPKTSRALMCGAIPPWWRR